MTSLVIFAVALAALPVVLLSAGCYSSPTSTETEGRDDSTEAVQTIEAKIVCTPQVTTLPATVKSCVTITSLVDSPRTVDGRIDLLYGGGMQVQNWRFLAVELDPFSSWDRCWTNEIPDFQSLVDKNIARLRVVDVTPPPYNQPPYPPSGSTAESVCYFWAVLP